MPKRRCEIVNKKKLGGGTYGNVYSAFHKKLKKHVAVKVSVFSQDNGVDYASLRESDFYRRVQCDFLPVVHAIEFNHKRRVQITMELGDEGCLYGWAKKFEGHVKVRVQLALDTLWNCLQVLSIMHTNGLLHRDIKPDNVLLFKASDGLVPKLADLGSCRLMVKGDRLSEKMCTPMYRPPEMNTHMYGKSSDVYSLGCTAIFVLAGNDPDCSGLEEHEGPSPKDWNLMLDSIKDLIPSDMYDLLKGMISEKPSTRATVQSCIQHALFRSKKPCCVTTSVRWVKWPGHYFVADFTAEDRANVVEFVGDIVRKRNLSNFVYVQAVHLMDDFFAKCATTNVSVFESPNTVWKYALVCLWIATKMFSYRMLYVEDLVCYGLREFSQEDFQRAELDVIKQLDFMFFRRPCPKMVEGRTTHTTVQQILSHANFPKGLYPDMSPVFVSFGAKLYNLRHRAKA